MKFYAAAVLLLFVSAVRGAADEEESCPAWAEKGECETNPDYMLQSCSESCARLESDINSLYDVVETDIDGKDISFDSFRGSIVYIVNVASQCGYTAENYELFRKLQQYRSNGVVMVIAPCNQFGRQEPGDAESILSFTKSQSFDGVILSKQDVNGPETRPIFKYLKKVTGKGKIDWNFDGKFLCDREGSCVTPSANVEDDILALLGGEEL